jgi:hypothetical protein
LAELFSIYAVFAEQQKKLASLLRASGIFETAVRHTVGNADAQRYADTFANAITSSGWSLRQPKFLIPLKETFGVWVLVQDREHPANGATQLLEALHACGIEAQGIEVSGLDPGSFDLMVGLPQ